MHRYNFIDWASLVLVVVGAINWGLVGLFGFDVVAAIFGSMTVATRIVYALVGLAGLYMIATGVKMGQEDHNVRTVMGERRHRAA